ncbi:uncharacterized protein LOC126164293 isoform X1 [Schistocerca cancellata]|uniref:uncharacterized protein LOC126164293 isoform X1 n=2 Tax=Schistocerca cancellata TaxID=274614 RepID=UPI002117A540|nr:uncharacterized protein LOC126164293 isoform X1 [Schistocerca cancellata]
MSQVYENIFGDALKDFRVSEDGLISGYCNSLEEVETLLDQLKTVGFSYCVRSSRFKEPSSDVMKSKTKHFFKQMQGHVPIPFFGCAFAVESVWSRHCVLGPKYYKSKESSVPEHLEDHVTPRKRLRIMDTRKSNCPATLNMKCIRVYPDYSMHSATEHRDTKAKVLASLQKDLALPCPPKSYLRYYLTASPASAHTHATESVEASGYIHPSLVKEIKNLVLSGMTSLKVIKLALDRFVEINFTGTHIPGQMNTTFYPTEKTIYSHIYRTLYGTNKVLFDETRLQNQVDEWHKDSSNHMIYYRHCMGANGEVKPLLFCYQSSWQRDLLKKYGGSCLLDATYKTTSYDIPLFFIAVKSNVGYLVVVFFFSFKLKMQDPFMKH